MARTRAFSFVMLMPRTAHSSRGRWKNSKHGDNRDVGILLSHRKIRLLDSGQVKVNERLFGETALLLGAQNGHVDLVQLLLQKGAAIDTQNTAGMTSLALAVSWNRLAVVKLLILHGANANIADRAGCRPLIWAAGGTDDINLVRILVDDGGADINLADNDGRTDNEGCMAGSPAHFEFLLDKSADIGVRGCYGKMIEELAQES